LGQIKGIESVLMNLEFTIGNITSPGGGSRSPEGFGLPHVHNSNSSNQSAFENSSNSGDGGGRSNTSKPLNTAKDALEQTEILREELAKSQAGITLLTQAVGRLDGVVRSPDKNGFCDTSIRQVFCGCLFQGSSNGPNPSSSGGSGSGGGDGGSSSNVSPPRGSSNKGVLGISDRMAGRPSYNRLLSENSGHDDADGMEMPATPGGRFTIEDD
jgi:hypothetical protein